MADTRVKEARCRRENALAQEVAEYPSTNRTPILEGIIGEDDTEGRRRRRQFARTEEMLKNDEGSACRGRIKSSNAELDQLEAAITPIQISLLLSWSISWASDYAPSLAALQLVSVLVNEAVVLLVLTVLFALGAKVIPEVHVQRQRSGGARLVEAVHETITLGLAGAVGAEMRCGVLGQVVAPDFRVGQLYASVDVCTEAALGNVVVSCLSQQLAHIRCRVAAALVHPFWADSATIIYTRLEGETVFSSRLSGQRTNSVRPLLLVVSVTLGILCAAADIARVVSRHGCGECG